MRHLDKSSNNCNSIDNVSFSMVEMKYIANNHPVICRI